MMGVPNPRADARHSSADARFLEAIRRESGSLHGLELMLASHSHKTTPRWKRVAIRRAISRLVRRPLEWVLGLDELDPCRMKQWQIDALQATRDRIESGR